MADYEAQTGTRNLARSGKGPDPNLTVEGVDFRVRVERNLKGTDFADLASPAGFP